MIVPLWDRIHVWHSSTTSSSSINRTVFWCFSWWLIGRWLCWSQKFAQYWIDLALYSAQSIKINCAASLLTFIFPFSFSPNLFKYSYIARFLLYSLTVKTFCCSLSSVFKLLILSPISSWFCSFSSISSRTSSKSSGNCLLLLMKVDIFMVPFAAFVKEPLGPYSFFQ